MDSNVFVVSSDWQQSVSPLVPPSYLSGSSVVCRFLGWPPAGNISPPVPPSLTPGEASRPGFAQPDCDLMLVPFLSPAEYSGSKGGKRASDFTLEPFSGLVWPSLQYTCSLCSSQRSTNYKAEACTSKQVQPASNPKGLSHGDVPYSEGSPHCRTESLGLNLKVPCRHQSPRCGSGLWS